MTRDDIRAHMERMRPRALAPGEPMILPIRVSGMERIGPLLRRILQKIARRRKKATPEPKGEGGRGQTPLPKGEGGKKIEEGTDAPKPTPQTDKKTVHPPPPHRRPPPQDP